MARVQLSQEVRAPTGAVFEFVDNHENYPQFFHGFSKFEWTTLGHEVGTRLKMEARVAGTEIPMELETTEVVPDGRISGQFVSGLEGALDWRFEPAEETTWVTMTADYRLPLSVLGKMVDRVLVERELYMNMEKTLAALKEQLEAGRRRVT